MQAVTHLGAIIALWAVVVITPGPDTLAVVSTTLRHSRADGMLVAIGCGLATVIWAAGSLAGLALLFAQASWLYHLVRLLGAAYLVFIGVRLVGGALRRSATGAAAAIRGARGTRAFRLGLLTDLSNPKATAFFTSLFAVALPPSVDAATKVMAVGAVGLVATVWYVCLAIFIGARPIARLYERSRRAIEAAAGALFIGLGAKLAVER